MNDKKFKSGFVAIAGAPNVGKSTLLNRLLGEKVSIISKKPQTTRNRILGFLTSQNSQIILIDTPGIHSTKKELNVRIVDAAVSAIGDADMTVFMIDASKIDEDSEAMTMKKVEARKNKVVLVLNKIDLVTKDALLPLIEKWTQAFDFEAVVPISAVRGDQVEELVSIMENALPEGPCLYPEDTLTDQPEKFIAAEMVREKVFRFTGEEIPYSTAVTVQKFEERADGSLISIYADIHIEKDSQKGIIIGKKGSKLKKIGEEARRDIERMVGTKVFLKLFVHVQKNWTRDTKALRRFGY